MKINYFRRARTSSMVQIKTMDELTTTNQNFQSNLSHMRTTVALTDQKVVNRIELETRESTASSSVSMITEIEIEK